MMMARGDGMYVCVSNLPGNKSYFLYNQNFGEKIVLLDSEGDAIFVKPEDFIWSDPVLSDYKETILTMHPRYGFSVNEFVDNQASVSWTLQPDGLYWADEDGYGGTDENEIEMIAIIDKNGNILKPFSCNY